MRHTTFSLALAFVFAVGCGGSQKAGEEQESSGGWLKDSDEEEYEETDDVLVPPEKYDEINAALAKKGAAVSRCFAKAIEDGGVSKNTKGTIVISLGIKPDGKATGVKVLPASSIKNDGLSECVIEQIASCRLPTLPKQVDTSYTYKLERDY